MNVYGLLHILNEKKHLKEKYQVKSHFEALFFPSAFLISKFSVLNRQYLSNLKQKRIPKMLSVQVECILFNNT